jgi:voltage-gated potassium channel Kch
VVGVLIVQDFVALAILLFVGGSGGEHNDVFKALPTWQYLIAMVVKVLILILLLSWLSRKLFPKFLTRFGKSDELLMVFSLAWALGLAAFMSLPVVGFSLEIGGFVAGLALANSQVHFEISARIKSLRDFFIIIFFIVFGTKLAFGGIGALFWPVLALCGFVLVGQPLIMMVIMGALGYKPRTSFFAAVTMSHISEFSFVLVALGNRLGHIPDAIVGAVTLVGVISIAASSYFITYTRKIFDVLSPYLTWLDFKKGSGEKNLEDAKLKNHIILAGANRLGSRFLASLASKNKIVVVDFDPHIVQKSEREGYLAICGDVTDPYIQEQVSISTAKIIVSTIPDLEDSLALLSAVKQQTRGQARRPKLIFVAQNDFESKYLYEEGVDYVLSPHFIGGLHLSRILDGDIGLAGLKSLRKQHLEVL